MVEKKPCPLPSPWFVWHADVIAPGMRVLDVACGRGRHAIAAARRGASVVALDVDAASLRHGEEAARNANVSIQWVQADLERDSLPAGPFDVVLLFNYLDRRRMKVFLDAVCAGGYLLGETFLERQRALGWGPTSTDHLLAAGEIFSLIHPYELVSAREALEMLDGRPMAVASVLARRPLR